MIDGSISYSTLYPIVTTIVYLISILNNSFDDGSTYMGGITRLLHKIVGGYRTEYWAEISKEVMYSTFASRFRVRTLLFLLSCTLYFIIF